MDEAAYDEGNSRLYEPRDLFMKNRTKPINVFLDDWRPCPAGFHPARTARECVNLLRKRSVAVLSLDHDLGIGRPSGYEVVKTMVRDRLYAKKIIIHSANPFGRHRMYHLLNRHKPRSVELLIRPEPLTLSPKSADSLRSVFRLLFGGTEDDSFLV
jgi:hypothetical protein